MAGMWLCHSDVGRALGAMSIDHLQAGGGVARTPVTGTCWNIFRITESLALVTLTKQAGEGR